MNNNKRNHITRKYYVYHERRRAARSNVDHNYSDSNNKNCELRERKHVLNVKLNRLRKIKKNKQCRFQSSNFNEKRKIRKKFEMQSKRVEDEIRSISNEKQYLIKLREINNRLIKENKNMKVQLEECRKLRNESENILNNNNNNENGFIYRVIHNLRRWLAML